MTGTAREKILEATLRIFQESGSRGTTTRRIAEAAEVNEVTLFRHFGSKDRLIQEALAWAAQRGEPQVTLPATPTDVRAELTDWATRHLQGLYHSAAFVRTCLGEHEERPDVSQAAAETPRRIARELTSYLRKVRDAGIARPDLDVDAASALLMGALFSDAMGRDLMPERYPYTIEEAPQCYVELFLWAIGAKAK